MKKKILVADDDADLLSLYHDLFSGEYDFKGVSSGHEVIETITFFNPDLLILDAIMPGKDALTLLEEMNLNQILPGKIILITGLVNIDLYSQEVCRKLNIMNVFSKPFDILELNHLVTECLHT